MTIGLIEIWIGIDTNSIPVISEETEEVVGGQCHIVHNFRRD